MALHGRDANRTPAHAWRRRGGALLVALAGCGPSEIQLSAVDAFADGTTGADPTQWESLAVRFRRRSNDPEQGETPERVPVTLSPDGTAVVSGVPEAPWVLEEKLPPSATTGDSLLRLRTQTARAVDLGRAYSCRSGLVPLTQPSFLEVSGALGSPWQTAADPNGSSLFDDELQVFSVNTGVVGFLTSDPSADPAAPLDGALALAGMRVDMSSLIDYSGLGLPALDAEKGDEVDLLHRSTTVLSDPALPAPWSDWSYLSVVEACHTAPLTLGDGASTPVDCDFVPAQPKSFSLDYRGDDFAALFSDAPAGMGGGYLSFTLSREPGEPLPETGATASLLDAFLPFFKVYDDPTCAPGCDPAACPNGCDSPFTVPLPASHAHELSYANPFAGGQELFGVLLAARYDFSDLLPADTPQYAYAMVSVSGPIADYDGQPAVPLVSLPRNLRLNAAPAPADEITLGVGTTPTLTFEPPTLGVPTYYVARVVAADDVVDGTGAVLSPGHTVFEAVFTVFSEGTSVTVPEGILTSGKHYFFVLEATLAPGVDLARPNVFGLRYATARTLTGLFTP